MGVYLLVLLTINYYKNYTCILLYSIVPFFFLYSLFSLLYMYIHLAPHRVLLLCKQKGKNNSSKEQVFGEKKPAKLACTSR